MSTKGKKTTSFRSLQHSIARDIQDIRDITVLYDKVSIATCASDLNGLILLHLLLLSGHLTL